MAKDKRIGIFSSKTNIGKVRVSNEDQALSLTNSNGDVLLVVCDGMGGHNKGDYASQTAVNLLADAFRDKSGYFNVVSAKFWLRATIKKINSVIYDEAFKNEAFKDMGTTMVVILIIADKIIVSNIGDSRAYKVQYDVLEQLTEDQTYVQYLYKTGKISLDEIKTHPNRHVLMNALGIYPAVNVDIRVFPYEGVPLLCVSDGVYNNISEKELHAILSTDDRIEQKIDSIIDVCNKNGGSDNMAISYF